MDVSELIDKFGSMVNEELTIEELWDKAHKGDHSILSDPRISKIKNSNDWTPLHVLANHGIKEVVDHPDSSKTKNNLGYTPLHTLAYRGVKEVWLHPGFYRIKSNKGETPKDVWLKYYKPLSIMDIAKLKQEDE